MQFISISVLNALVIFNHPILYIKNSAEGVCHWGIVTIHRSGNIFGGYLPRRNGDIGRKDGTAAIVC